MQHATNRITISFVLIYPALFRLIPWFPTFCVLRGRQQLEWFDAQPDKGQYLKGLILADKQRQIQEQQEKETNEILLSEDAVQTTAYLANAPDCCSGAEQFDNMLGMLGADVMDEDVYHSEDQHPEMSM